MALTNAKQAGGRKTATGTFGTRLSQGLAAKFAPPQPDMNAVKAYLDAMNAARSSGGGGGGGYSMPAYDPMSDPAYQTLLNALDVQEHTARTGATQTIQGIQQEAAIEAPRIAERGQEERRGINNQQEARGTFRSGERLRRVGLQQQAEQHRGADLQRNAAERTRQVNQKLSETISELARQRADAALQASMRAGR